MAQVRPATVRAHHCAAPKWFEKPATASLRGRTALAAVVRHNRQTPDALGHLPQSSQSGGAGQAFEGIAQTRVRLLNNWANQQWVHLEGFAQSAGLSPINN